MFGYEEVDALLLRERVEIILTPWNELLPNFGSKDYSRNRAVVCDVSNDVMKIKHIKLYLIIKILHTNNCNKDNNLKLNCIGKILNFLALAQYLTGSF